MIVPPTPYPPKPTVETESAAEPSTDSPIPEVEPVAVVEELVEAPTQPSAQIQETAAAESTPLSVTASTQITIPTIALPEVRVLPAPLVVEPTPKAAALPPPQQAEHIAHSPATQQVECASIPEDAPEPATAQHTEPAKSLLVPDGAPQSPKSPVANPSPVAQDIAHPITQAMAEPITRIATDVTRPTVAESPTPFTMPVTTDMMHNTMMGYLLIQIAAMSVGWWIIAEGSMDSWQFGIVFIALAVYLQVKLLSPLITPWHPIIGLYFMLFFVRESFIGGLDIAQRTLNPSLPISPCWFTYPVGLCPSLARSLFINSVSLMPGTLSVELTPEGLLVHSLTDDPNAQKQIERLEELIAQMFFLDLTEKNTAAQASGHVDNEN